MKKLRKIILATAAIIMMTSGTLHAENGNRSGSSTAVMEISVEVISGTIVEASSNEVFMSRNSTDNRVESNQLGDIRISLQDGLEIITEFQDVVRMNNETNSWNLEVNVTEHSNGSVKTFSLSGKSNGDEVSDGAYTGTQVAVIEYL